MRSEYGRSTATERCRSCGYKVGLRKDGSFVTHYKNSYDDSRCSGSGQKIEDQQAANELRDTVNRRKKHQVEIIVGLNRRAFPVTTVHTVDVKIMLRDLDAEDVLDQIRRLFAVQHKLIVGDARSWTRYKFSANNVPALDRALNYLEEQDLLGE